MSRRKVVPPRAMRLVATKLRPPSIRFALIARPRLLAPVDEIEAIRVVLVHAPAGYGKTSLLVQWSRRLEERGVPSGWLTLDPDDDDPSRLLLHLAAAFARTTSSDAIGELALGRRGQTHARGGAAIDSLPLPPPPFVLFLDDFDRIGSDASRALLRGLVERAPDGIHFVLASRALPHLGLGRLRLAGALVEVDARTLRFAAPEVDALLASRGIALAADVREELFERTEGWVGALQLAALALRDRRRDPRRFVRSLSGAYGDLAAYLAEEVLASQDEEERRFLLETSPLDRLHPALCDAVRGRTDGARLLERLEAKGLLLERIGDDGEWRRSHPLFADFLRRELARSRRSEIPGIHRRAAEWLIDAGHAVEAVAHALASGDPRLAGRAVAVASAEVMPQGQFHNVTTWARALPAEALDGHPAIRARAAWAHAALHELDEARAELDWVRARHAERELDAETRDDFLMVEPLLHVYADRLEPTLRAAEEGLRRVSGENSFPRGGLRDMLAYALVAAGRFDEAARVLAAARGDHVRAGSRFGLAFTVSVTGVLHAIRGDLAAAETSYREAETIAAADALDPAAAQAAILGYFAELLYERNRLDDAAERLERGLARAAVIAGPDMIGCAYRTAARLAVARGDAETALGLVDEAEAVARERRWPRQVAIAGRERVWIALRTGSIGDARDAAARIEGDLSGGDPPSFLPHGAELEAEDLALLRLRAHDGGGAAVAAALGRAAWKADGDGRAWRALRLLVVQAVAHRLAGERPLALRAMREALRRGAAGRFVRSYVDEGPVAIELVAEIREATLRGSRPSANDPPLEHLERVLAAAADEGASAVSIPAPAAVPAPEPEALSPRELEILEALAAGLSNRAVAERLLVSENTVKWHLQHVFAKLGAANRVQAVVVARERALIR